MINKILVLTFILFSILFFKITTALDREHKRYEKYTNEYIEILKEGMAIQEEMTNSIIDHYNYYKKAYEDTITEHINILKRINKKNKIGGNTNE